MHGKQISQKKYLNISSLMIFKNKALTNSSAATKYNNELVCYREKTFIKFKNYSAFILDHLFLKLKQLIVLLLYLSIIASIVLIETFLFVTIYRIVQAYDRKSFHKLFKYISEKISIDIDEDQ